jgi:hypothetical protein
VQGSDVDVKDTTATETGADSDSGHGTRVRVIGADSDSGHGTGSYSKTTGKFLIDMRASHDNIATHAAKLLAERTAEAGKSRPYCRFTQEVFDSTADDRVFDSTREVQTPVRGPCN